MLAAWPLREDGAIPRNDTGDRALQISWRAPRRSRSAVAPVSVGLYGVLV